MQNDEQWFDADIQAMRLDYGEKAGLQIFRNYQRSFEDHAVAKLVTALDRVSLDLTPYTQMAEKIVTEDSRYLPVLICAFADELLTTAFKQALPDGIPGGKGAMLRGFGPLSDLAKRIQLAYAFDVLSADLMTELDKVRSVRNKLAHSWDISDFAQFFSGSRIADVHPIEELLFERSELATLKGPLDTVAAFRVRMVWILGRLVYEAATYHRVKAARIRPERVLYGKPIPKWLVEVSRIALDTTRRILTEGGQGQR